MTTHPTDGDLRTFLDGEVDDAEERRIRNHLRECARCRDAAAALRGTAAQVRRRLALLDPPARTDEAFRAVQERLTGSGEPADDLAGGRATGRRPWAALPGVLRGSLARAALLVLALGAGASAAVPGSPVRAWLGAAWSTLTDGGPAAEEAAAGAAADPARSFAASEEATVRVPTPNGAARVELSGVPPEASIRVRFPDGASAGVTAPARARFRSGEGTVRASLADVPDRAPRIGVELPRGLSRGELIVNGRAYLRVRDGRIELPGPAPERMDGDYLFSGAPPSGRDRGP